MSRRGKELRDELNRKLWGWWCWEESEFWNAN